MGWWSLKTVVGNFVAGDVNPLSLLKMNTALLIITRLAHKLNVVTDYYLHKFTCFQRFSTKYSASLFSFLRF